MNTTQNPETMSNTSRTRQRLTSHAPQKWTPGWMFSAPELLLLLAGGSYLTYISSEVVTHRPPHYQFTMWDEHNSWLQTPLLIFGVVLVLAAIHETRRNRTARMMHPYGDLRRWANESADRLLRTQKVNEIPVDPLRVAERLGVEIITDDRLPTPTQWRRRPDHAYSALVMNPNLVDGLRLRFEIAHAIGHCLRESECVGDEAEEFCCHEFAGALLMPSAWFAGDAKREYDDDKLAARYGVTIGAVKIRRRTVRSVDPRGDRELKQSRRSFGWARSVTNNTEERE